MGLVIPRNGKDYLVGEGGRLTPISLPPITWKKENRWIRTRRRMCGLSLRQLACQSGMGTVELGELERGVRKPEASEVLAIRRALEQTELAQLQSQFS